MITSLLPILQSSAYDTDLQMQPEISLGTFLVIGAISLAFILFIIACAWKLIAKAGKPGWYSLIPIYNLVVIMRMAGKSGWWVLLTCIPFVGIIFAFLAALGLAKNFGKSTGFGIGLAFLGIIFLPILAFGDARYIGPRD